MLKCLRELQEELQVLKRKYLPPEVDTWPNFALESQGERLQNLIVVQHCGWSLVRPVNQYSFLYCCIQACEAKKPGFKQVQFTGRSKSINDTTYSTKVIYY